MSVMQWHRSFNNAANTTCTAAPHDGITHKARHSRCLAGLGTTRCRLKPIRPRSKAAADELHTQAALPALSEQLQALPQVLQYPGSTFCWCYGPHRVLHACTLAAGKTTAAVVWQLSPWYLTHVKLLPAVSGLPLTGLDPPLCIASIAKQLPKSRLPRVLTKCHMPLSTSSKTRVLGVAQ